MAINLVRYREDVTVRWGVIDARGIRPLEGTYPTTGDLIRDGRADIRSTAARPAGTAAESV